MVQNILKAVIIVILLSFPAFSQELVGSIEQSIDDPTITEGQNSKQNKQAASVFDEVERAIQTGYSENLVNHLSKKIYLNLRGNNNGYFSANQASYILQEFFEKYKLSNVHFTERGFDADEAYSSGTAVILIRGKYEPVKVYIGLSKTGTTYQISQLTIL